MENDSRDDSVYTEYFLSHLAAHQKTHSQLQRGAITNIHIKFVTAPK